MAANQVATNYNQIMNAINSMNDARMEMYNAINAINQQIDATVNWQGEDAQRYKNTTKDMLQKLWNSAKWMNEATWRLSEHAKRMLQNSEENAANARYFGN